MAVDLGLFFLIPEPEDLVGDGVVVFLVAGRLDEVFLELLDPCMNAFRKECVSRDNRLGDTLLQLL